MLGVFPAWTYALQRGISVVGPKDDRIPHRWSYNETSLGASVMNDLTVGHRFIANYVKHDKVLFRLIVEFEVQGWSAHIFDRRNISEQNKEPIRAYYESVSSPEQGMHSLEIRLAWLLGRDVLPILPLVWRETLG